MGEEEQMTVAVVPDEFSLTVLEFLR